MDCKETTCTEQAVALIKMSRKDTGLFGGTIETSILWEVPDTLPRGYAKADPVCKEHLVSLVGSLAQVLV